MRAQKVLKSGKIIIPAGCHVWPHEMHVAKILAMAGHIVEFLPTNQIKTADVRLDGVEFEIKSPKSGKANSLEHLLKKAAKQSVNIIIDASRVNQQEASEEKICRYLVSKARQQKQIKKLLFIKKNGSCFTIPRLR